MNFMVIKRMMGLTVMGFLPVLIFYLFATFYGFWIGLIALPVGMICAQFIAARILKHPFTDMQEGAGLLAIDLNSTGVIRPFILRYSNAELMGALDKTKISGIFDRNVIMNLTEPVKVKEMLTFKDGKINFSIPQDEYTKAKFAFQSWPVILYNSQVKSIITKDFIAEKEKTTFAENSIIYLNKKLEDLTSVTRDFARYVVEMTKPKGKGFFSNPIVIIVIVILLVVLGVALLPMLLEAMGPAVGAAQQAAGGVADTARGSLQNTPVVIP